MTTDQNAAAVAADQQAHTEWKETWKERQARLDDKWAVKDAERRTDGAATATLVLGILSFLFGPLALIAFITSYFGTRNGSRTAGLVCAWIAVVLTAAAAAYIVYAANKVGGFNPYGYSTDSSFVTP